MGTDVVSHDAWSSGDSYERYVGRWSRLVAREFIHWLAAPEDSQWLDLGCGTGALSQTILELTNPKKVKGIDRSESYVDSARSKVKHPNVQFDIGDARALPVESQSLILQSLVWS
jgi:ubiquinone/menaquinone biosynthesis C-methylase UbiE